MTRGCLLFSRCAPRVQAPRTDIGDVREVIREELGDFPEKLWKSFDPEPIASASLAQVHRALSWDGVELAVKVRCAFVAESRVPAGNGNVWNGSCWLIVVKRVSLVLLVRTVYYRSFVP